jgi:Mor family transcriptional regulator
MDTTEIISTFDSTHHALKFEKTLKENGIKLIVMPVPREISASCGLAVKFSIEDFDKAKELVKKYEISVKKFYQIIIQSHKRAYSEKSL